MRWCVYGTRAVTLFHTFFYIIAGASLRHIHACVWPTLLTNLLKFATTSLPQIKTKKDDKEDRSTTQAGGSTETTESLKINAEIALECLTLSLLEGDTSSASYGVCISVCIQLLHDFKHILTFISVYILFAAGLQEIARVSCETTACSDIHPAAHLHWSTDVRCCPVPCKGRDRATDKSGYIQKLKRYSYDF